MDVEQPSQDREPSFFGKNWMRDYDPTTGRYIQAEPLGLVDGASVYGYALQNPGRYVDPRGERSSSFGNKFGPLGIAGAVAPGSTLGDALGQSHVNGRSSVLPASTPQGSASEIGQNQCPDPCEDAKKRVRNAKAQHDKYGKGNVQVFRLLYGSGE